MERGSELEHSIPGFGTALNAASRTGVLEVVRYLVLNQSADVDGAFGRLMPSPLFSAAESGHEDVVRFLVESGADVNRKYQNIYSPLHGAALSGNADIVRFLLEKGIEYEKEFPAGFSPLHISSREGHAEVTRVLLQEAEIYVDVEDMFGETPLFFAAKGDHFEVVDILIESGAEVSAQNHLRETVLYELTRESRIRMLSRLCEKYGASALDGGAEPDPWEFAAVHEMLGVVRVLHDSCRADVNRSNHEHFTALHSAVISANLEMLEYLIERGADINAKASWLNASALHLASAHADADIVEKLLESGAELDAETAYMNMTPMEEAVVHGRIDLIEIFLRKGANITHRHL